MRTSSWYTKDPLSQSIYESLTGTLEANIDRMSLVDRLDRLEYWTKWLVKGQMNFDVKLNTLAKELIGKVFGKMNSSMLQDSLNYCKHLDFPQGEHSRVKGERDTKADYKA